MDDRQHTNGCFQALHEGDTLPLCGLDAQKHLALQVVPVQQVSKADILLTEDILCSAIYLQEVQYMNIDDWRSQIKRGTLEFCILLMIKHRPSYGYEIISTLEKYPILAAKENTIYPLLRRLMKEDYVSSSWQESTAGLPPRKYYSITDKGLACISAMSEEWNNLLNAIHEIKGE